MVNKEDAIKALIKNFEVLLRKIMELPQEQRQNGLRGIFEMLESMEGKSDSSIVIDEMYV